MNLGIEQCKSKCKYFGFLLYDLKKSEELEQRCDLLALKEQ